MESPPSSRLIFYDQAGTVIPSPVEGSICGIAIDVPIELRPYISLRLGGYVMPVFANEGATYAEWPASSAGHYELFLDCHQIREQRRVTVMPRCFAESDFDTIVRDLTEALPHSIVSKLLECGANVGAIPARDGRSALEEEFHKLRRAIRGTNEQLGILQILPLLQHNCQKILKSKLELRSINKLRRPDMSRLPQAMSIPGNVVSATRLYQMFDTTVEGSLEAYENKLVKVYVLAVRSRLLRLQGNLKAANAPPAMAAELDTLAAEFHQAFIRALFLREVRHPSISSLRVTMVLLKNPAYRAALEGYIALNDSSAVLTLEDPALKAPLNNFPHLYQRWVTLTILNALVQVGAESGFQCVSHHWIKTNIKQTSVLPLNDGLPAVQLSCPKTGRLVSFVPWTASAGTTNGGTQDIPMGAAITIETPGKPLTILLFDPKYWVDYQKVDARAKKKKSTKPEENDIAQTLPLIEPLKDDVDKMIRYREMVKAANNGSEIRYSAILYPGKRKQLNPDLEAVPAHPSNRDGLQKTVYDVLRRQLATSR